MNKRILPYNPKLVPLAKKLRKNSTLSEILLWQHLKKKQFQGYDFHRQKPIGNYIVDFFCPELLLVVEIDGSSHRFPDQADTKRQRKPESMGVRVVRFADQAVKQEMDQVLRELIWHVEHRERVIQP